MQMQLRAHHSPHMKRGHIGGRDMIPSLAEASREAATWSEAPSEAPSEVPSEVPSEAPRRLRYRDWPRCGYKSCCGELLSEASHL